MTDSFHSRLTAWGFHRDPFAFPDAETMDPNALEETFVVHPGFDEHVMDLSRSVVLLAPSGSGKTAGRRRLEVFLTSQQRKLLSSQETGGRSPVPLAVSYCDFERMVDRLPNTGLSDYVPSLLEAIAKAVYSFIKEYPEHIMAVSQQERNWWCRFLVYLEDEDTDDWMLTSPLASNWRQTRALPAPFRSDSRLRSILGGLQTHLASLGISSLYILVDGVDGYLQTQSLDKLEVLVAPLLNTLSLFSFSYVVWKLFLPMPLEQLALRSAGYMTWRLNLVSIHWDEPSLTRFLQQRLEWASDVRDVTIAQFCDQQLSSTVDIERELVQMALRHPYLGPPRALLKLGSQLLRSHAMSVEGSTMLLSLNDWNDFKNKVKEEFITAETTSSTINNSPVTVYEFLVAYFSEDELSDLCFKLGTDYGDFPGQGKRAKAREIVTYYYRRGHIVKLYEAARNQRPDAPYPAPSNAV